MITIRPATERGAANHGWLDTRHTFSFASYFDERFLGFRNLRVINEDRVAPGAGFGSHPHRDMEIISYVLEGALQHRDSLGTGSVITPGDVQRMSAGTGVVHSEFNGSQTAPVHFLQIWLIPNAKGVKPGYEQKRFEDADKQGRLRVIVSPDGRDGSLKVHADASVYAGRFAAGERATLALEPGRHAWVQAVRGAVQVNGQRLSEGDGAAIADEGALDVVGVNSGEVLVFDLE